MCLKRGIQFSCTPFYLEAVEELRPLVAFYKCRVYELLVDDLLKACARSGKPVVLSTGMATMEEIVHAANVLKDAGASDVTLLHCVFAYPTQQRKQIVRHRRPSAKQPGVQSAGPITRAVRQ